MLLSMSLPACFVPFVTSRCEAVSVAPIRGREDVPRDRMESLSRSIPDAVDSERLFGKLSIPRL